MEQVLYGPPHVKCLHVLYDSYGPPYLIWDRYYMVPPTCMCGSPTCIIWLLWSPYTLYGIGILWPPYLIWNRYCMVPTCMYGPPHVKCLHVLYDLWSPHTLWNRYHIVPQHVLYDLWPPYLIWNRYLMVPHTLYGIGIIWSLPHVCMVPHMWSAFMSYMTLIVPLTLYGIGIIWSPHMYVWSPPHVRYDVSDSYGPLFSYMEQVSYGPPTCTIWFFQDSIERGPLRFLMIRCNELLTDIPLSILGTVKTFTKM